MPELINPTNDFSVITVTAGYPATQLVWPEEITVHLRNIDPNNTVYLGSNQAILAGDLNNTVPLAPNGSYVAGGNVSVYGICSPGKTAQIARTPDSVNFFLPPSLAQLGGSNIYVQTSAPTQPPTIPLNSVWYNTTPNNQSLNTWNGSAWVQVAVPGTNLIEAGTIIATLLAAGIVVAGIVDGTLIQAATFIGGNYFGYSGANPAANTLIVSLVPSTGTVTDSVGNVALPGVTVYTQQAASNYSACSLHDSKWSFSGATSEAGPWTEKVSFFAAMASGAITAWNLQDTANGISLFSGSDGTRGILGFTPVSGTAEPFMLTGDPVIGGTTLEIWHDMRPLLNSFIGTNTGIWPPQYRRTVDGWVEIFGSVKTPPTTGNYNAVTFATLPAAYRPGSNDGARWCAKNVADGAATPVVHIDTSGNLFFNFLPASLAQTTIEISGRFPINATGLITS